MQACRRAILQTSRFRQLLLTRISRQCRKKASSILSKRHKVSARLNYRGCSPCLFINKLDATSFDSEEQQGLMLETDFEGFSTCCPCPDDRPAGSRAFWRDRHARYIVQDTWLGFVQNACHFMAQAFVSPWLTAQLDSPHVVHTNLNGPCLAPLDLDFIAHAVWHKAAANRRC